MTKIKFISAQVYPDDQYTKESVIICLDDKYRFTYIKKSSRNGGFFWVTPSFSTVFDGERSYGNAFELDSKSLEEEVKLYLNQRSWEKESNQPEERKAELNSTESLPF